MIYPPRVFTRFLPVNDRAKCMEMNDRANTQGRRQKKKGQNCRKGLEKGEERKENKEMPSGDLDLEGIEQDNRNWRQKDRQQGSSHYWQTDGRTDITAARSETVDFFTRLKNEALNGLRILAIETFVVYKKRKSQMMKFLFRDRLYKSEISTKHVEINFVCHHFTVSSEISKIPWISLLRSISPARVR